MKEIMLTQNQVALVDDEDYSRITDMGSWFADYSKNVKGYYAKRNMPAKNGKYTTIRMHRVIMNCPNDKQIDHKNHDTLDNRKKNLRICVNSENQHNRKSHKITSSRFKGVTLFNCKKKNKTYKYWVARININGKEIRLGYFESEIQASRAYDKKAKELFGEFALLNKGV